MYHLEWAPGVSAILIRVERVVHSGASARLVSVDQWVPSKMLGYGPKDSGKIEVRGQVNPKIALGLQEE
jgi:hypothetical protein